MVRRKSVCIRGKGKEDRRKGVDGGRALIEPEKDPASKFIESSHDFSRSGLKTEEKDKSTIGERSGHNFSH